MALNKCGLCGSARSVMRTTDEGARVCVGKAERQCAAKRGLGEARFSRGGARLRTRKDKAGNRRRAFARAARWDWR